MLESTYGYFLSCPSPRTSQPSVASSMWTKLDYHFSCESAVKATLLLVQLLVGEEIMKIYRTGKMRSREGIEQFCLPLAIAI